MTTAPTNIIQFESFNGFAIGVRPADTYIDATALCRANKKLIGHYTENKHTREFLEELSANIGIPILELVVSQVGGNHAGTYVHPRVAIHLAQWASPKCAVWVTDLVYRYLTGETISAKADQAKAPKDPQSLFWSNVERLTGMGATPTSAVYAATKLLEGHAPRKRDGIHPKESPKAADPNQGYKEDFHKVFHSDEPAKYGELLLKIEDKLKVSIPTAQRRIRRWVAMGLLNKIPQGYRKSA